MIFEKCLRRRPCFRSSIIKYTCTMFILTILISFLFHSFNFFLLFLLSLRSVGRFMLSCVFSLLNSFRSVEL